jgi:hypothetical protein
LLLCGSPELKGFRKETMNKIKILLQLVLLSPVLVLAQASSEYEQWKQAYLGEFDQYKDAVDKEFAGFLKQKWKPFSTEAGFIRDETPKPVAIPIAKPLDIKPVIKDPISSPAIPKPKVITEVIKPVIKVKPPAIIQPPISGKQLSVLFLGYTLSIADTLSSVLTGRQSKVTQQTIQSQFSDLAKSDYPSLVKRLLSLKRELNLNDWAYVSLINGYTEQLAAPKNSQVVASWFLMLKSGLNARVAFNEKSVFLLVAVKQSLYGIAFFRYGKQKYYSVSQQKNLPPQLLSYDGHYPEKLALSDFSPLKVVVSNQNNQIRQLAFSYKRQKHQLEIPYNQYTVDFLATYPQMDIGQYFHSPLNETTANALLSQLKPMVKDLSETEAVNFLLSFVQNAFKYETDGEQFGAENYMFIEETLHYRASDCEDRSIIFAWLVKNLLNLEVVGLEFPGHIATAVVLKKPEGTAIRHDNKTYTIADPTYINARVGMKMPQYKNVAPKVVSN